MDEKGYNGILIGILIISLGLLFFANASAITGYATEAVTTSNVTIQKYLAIDPSTDLETGIVFEEILALPITNNNATNNYDGPSNATKYYINVSTDSNTQVDFCILANAGLTTDSADVIGLGNETYVTNVTTSNMTIPDVSNEISMTTGYIEAATAVPVGNTSYWRFFLDVPVGQASGDYNNSVSFKGVTAGTSC